jgi:hypothetical protein
MPASISYPEPVPPTEQTAPVSCLRTVTGKRFPRRCACGCGHAIPHDPEVRYVVDFGSAKPYPAYLREHSPDYGTYHGGGHASPKENSARVAKQLRLGKSATVEHLRKGQKRLLDGILRN